LIDKLVHEGVLFPGERQKLKEQEGADIRVDVLMKILRTKSPAQFDSFLTSLSETDQQSVADVRQAMHTAGQTGHNPLHHLYGKHTTVLARHALRAEDNSHTVSIPLTPSTAIWVQLQSNLCQTGLSRHL